MLKSANIDIFHLVTGELKSRHDGFGFMRGCVAVSYYVCSSLPLIYLCTVHTNSHFFHLSKLVSELKYMFCMEKNCVTLLLHIHVLNF